MKIALIVLCLVACAQAAPRPERQLTSAAIKISLCEARLHEAPCLQCCQETNWGLLGFAEEPGCELACQILPE